FHGRGADIIGGGGVGLLHLVIDVSHGLIVLDHKACVLLPAKIGPHVFQRPGGVVELFIAVGYELEETWLDLLSLLSEDLLSMLDRVLVFAGGVKEVCQQIIIGAALVAGCNVMLEAVHGLVD